MCFNLLWLIKPSDWFLDTCSRLDWLTLRSLRVPDTRNAQGGKTMSKAMPCVQQNCYLDTNPPRLASWRSGGREEVTVQTDLLIPSEYPQLHSSWEIGHFGYGTWFKAAGACTVPVIRKPTDPWFCCHFQKVSARFTVDLIIRWNYSCSHSTSGKPWSPFRVTNIYPKKPLALQPFRFCNTRRVNECYRREDPYLDIWAMSE